jgi:hypothetical protein
MLLGNGDGTFTMGTSLSAGYTVLSVIAGDFNGDGRPDLAVVSQATFHNASCDLYIYLGNGDGTFQPPVLYTAGGSPWSLAAADLNADGKLDLVAENGDAVAILLGNGDGTSQLPSSYALGGGAMYLAGF